MLNLVVQKNTLGQKALTVAEYLVSAFPSEFIISHQINNDYKNIILTQIPNFYDKTGKIKSIIKAIHFIRPIYKLFPNQVTNGFSVFKHYNNFYKGYIPMFYPYDQKCPVPNKINIGYYDAPYRGTRQKCFDFIKKEAKNIDNMTILGQNSHIKHYIKKLIPSINIDCLSDKDKFFSNITHLLVPMSENFVDPHPTVMEEAIHCNKQIIVLEKNRSWKDGIDDLCSCIKFHKKLAPDVWYDNTNSLLNSFDYDKYYKKLIETEFEIQFDTTKIDNLNDFLKLWQK